MTGETLKPCPFCGRPAKRGTAPWGTPTVTCSSSSCDVANTVWDVDDWNRRPAEDALRAERDVALAEVDARRGFAASVLAEVDLWRGFAASFVVAVHPGDAGLIIADHLATEDLPELLAAVEHVVGARDAAMARAERAEAEACRMGAALVRSAACSVDLRAVIAEAAEALVTVSGADGVRAPQVAEAGGR